MKTFKFILKERNGEQKYSYDYLVYAETLENATKKMNNLAETWYGYKPEYNQDFDCYEFFAGCIAVSVEGGSECSVEGFTKDLVNRYTLR